MNDYFGAARAALDGAPSLSSFATLCRAVRDAWGDDPGRAAEQLLPYALAHLESWPDEARALPSGRVVPPSMTAELAGLYDEVYLDEAPYGGEDDALDLDAFEDDPGAFGRAIVLYDSLIYMAKELHLDAPYVDGDFVGSVSPEAFVRDLVGWEGVEHFTGLWLHCEVNGSVGFGSLMSEALIELIGLGAFDGFSSLNLSDHYVGAAGIVALSRLSHLRALCLHQVDLDTPRLAALSSAPEMAGLRRLDLSCRHAGRRDVLDLRAIADPGGCAWRELEHLDVSRRRLAPGSVAALARATHLSSLRTLGLDGCDVAPGELATLARTPHLHTDLRRALSGT